MPIQSVSDVVRDGYGAFTRLVAIPVTTSRVFAISDIGNLLVCTAAVTLSVPTGLGVAGDLIFIKRIGAAAVVTISAETGTLYDPYSSLTILDHGIGCIQCESPGVWSRQG